MRSSCSITLSINCSSISIKSSNFPGQKQNNIHRDFSNCSTSCMYILHGLSMVRFLHASKRRISPHVQPTRWYGPHKLNDITCATFMVNSSSMEYTPSRLHTPMAYCLPSRKNITPMGSLLSSSTLMLVSFVTDKIDLISERCRSSKTVRIFALVGQ